MTSNNPHQRFEAAYVDIFFNDSKFSASIYASGCYTGPLLVNCLLIQLMQRRLKETCMCACAFQIVIPYDNDLTLIVHLPDAQDM